MRLRLAYDSEEGREFASRIMREIQEAAIATSQALAEEKGVFPNYPLSVWAERGVQMRNASLTNIAPTGSTSLLVGVANGIEPHYALAWRRPRSVGGQMQTFVVPWLEEALRDAGVWSAELMEEIVQRGTLKGIDCVPDDVKRVFVTAMDVSAVDHVRMQAAVQRYCCNAISKTINFPRGATRDDFRAGFVLAWQLKSKGVTGYRDGSREEQPVQTVEGAKSTSPVAAPALPGCASGTCDL